MPNPPPAAGWPSSDSSAGRAGESEAEDIRLLLDTVAEKTGLDFREYAYSSIRRRVNRVSRLSGESSVAGLHRRVRADGGVLETLVRHLTVHTTQMFRDPGFFRELRLRVVPTLRTYPFARIWVAGCSTGEEVYSLSILLREEGLARRCRIYATDVSDVVLDRARSGIFPLSAMQEYSRNYRLAGGTAPFSDYYTADSEWVVFRQELRDNVVFGTHNLASDASFNEFHLILCRNVLIYFQRPLQERVHSLFHESLVMFGFLGLGRSESVRFTRFRHAYETLAAKERLFRRTS